jgi:adenine-specific DNA-methyltransferase
MEKQRKGVTMPTLNWIGREAVLDHHNQVPYRLLCCDGDLSAGDGGDGNLLIEGDNLEALKALLPYYAGQVKCIYIDPPYNTGNEDWVYNDAVNSPQMRDWLGQVVGADDLSRHDKWLCMMYPRLRLLWEMLCEDGVIIAAIDDNEFMHLRFLMDEVFGENNWLGTLVWEKTRKNDAKFFSIGHDYMLVYGRNVDHLRSIGTIWREAKPGAAEIMEEYRRLRALHGADDRTVEKALSGWYRSLPENHPSKRLSRYKHVDNRGVWRDRDISWPGGGGPRYDVIHPKTGKACVVPERGWGFATSESMQKQIDLGLVVFRDDHTEPPIRKAYLSPVTIPLEGYEDLADESDQEAEDIGLQVMPSVIYKHTQPSVRLLRRIMGAKVFSNPKDHEVLIRLIRYVTKPGDIILDSFAGSGSTGHAVLQMNREDGGHRRFILVEMEPKIARDTTVERLRSVIQGYTWRDQQGRERREAGLGGGFRYCTLGPSLFDEAGAIRPEVSFDNLAAHIYFAETGGPLPARPGLDSPCIGQYGDISYYLFFNGVRGGSRLDTRALRHIQAHAGPIVVYADGCALSDAALAQRRITFKQIPYEVTTR